MPGYSTNAIVFCSWVAMVDPLSVGRSCLDIA